MDKLPAEVEAMPYAEGRPYMDELAAQLADGGEVSPRSKRAALWSR